MAYGFLALLFLFGQPFKAIAQRLNTTPRRAKPALQAIVLLLVAAAACAQQPSRQEPAAAKQMPATSPTAAQFFSSYEGQTVASVELAGRPDLNPSRFTAMMAQKPGEPFSPAKVEQTAAALKKTGEFKQVRIQVEPAAKGVRVIYVLEPADWIGIYTFPGAQRFAYSELIQASNYPVQEPFNEKDMETDRRSLQTFFQQEGFFEAQVHAQPNTDAKHDITNVEFHVQLERKAKFGSAIAQGGAPEISDAQLDHDLTTLWARLHGAGIRPGKDFHRSTVEHATHYLESKLRGQGYLGAQVKLTGAEYDPATNRADIHFSVKPGVKTHVKITGAHLWSWDKKDLLPVYQGIGVDQESVQEGRTALISYFQAKGYFNVKVDAQLKKAATGDTVLYQITKEKKHKVTSVHITGNGHLSDSKLTPSIAVQKKHLFSPGKFSDNLVRTSVDNLTGIYKADGYSDVKVTSSVRTTNGNIEVSFHVVEGPRDIVNEVVIEGANTFPESKFAPHGLKVRVGQPYSAAHVEEDRTEIIANYLKAGYLNASFRETAAAASKQHPHQIDVIYHIDEGPRVITGDVITLGRKDTSPRLIKNDIASIKPEQPLREQDLLTAGSKLYDLTGVFDWAEVDPKRQITTQSTEDVLIKLHEAKKNEFQYGFGFEVIERGGSIPSGTVALPNLPPIGLPSNFTTSEKTFYGPRGTAQYTRNNLRGKGESLTATAFAGRLDQRGALYYIDPNFRWSSWKATSSASFERNEENPIFSAQIATASTQLQKPVDHAQKNVVFFRYSYSRTDLTHVLIPALVPARDQHVNLSTFSANFTRDTRNNPLDSTRGVLDSMEVDFNSSKLGSTVDFAKLTAQSAFYKEAFHHIVWADSIRIGLAEPFNSSFVPLSEEFFTGGGNTLRGYPLDGAGPQRQVSVCSSGASSACSTIQVPSGGNELLVINSEARIPLSWIKKNLGYVLFYDGGNVFPYVGFHDVFQLASSNKLGIGYSNSVGFGLRYATPVGPIRFDIGRNLNPVPGIGATQYFVGIGQAF